MGTEARIARNRLILRNAYMFGGSESWSTLLCNFYTKACKMRAENTYFPGGYTQLLSSPNHVRITQNNCISKVILAMNNHEKMLKRLQFLQKSDPEFAIPELKSRGLVSDFYDFRNLATDLWLLTARPARRRIEYFHDPRDPLRSLWFCCLIVAIGDARDGRPCDLGAWRRDAPPMGIETCSSASHICAPHALGFLLSLPPEHELFCGLRPGTIRELLRGVRIRDQNFEGRKL